MVGAANRYVEYGAVVAGEGAQGGAPGRPGGRTGTVLYNLVEALRLIAELLVPFLPETAAKIAAQVGVPLDSDAPWASVTSWGRLAAGTHTQPGPVLFRKWEAPE